MAKIREESLRLNIIINGDKARKDVADTEKGLDVLLKAQKRLIDMRRRLENSGRTETKQYQDLEVAIRDNALQVEEYRRKLNNLKKGMPLTSMTLGELRKHAAQVRVALSKAVPGTENFKKLSAELNQTKAHMKKLNQTADATRTILGTQIQGWGDLWAVIHSGISAVTRVWGMITQATDAYMEYDEALTDAMKTTNLTKEEVTALSDELKKFDTRTAQNELLALLRIGGKLGVEGEDNLLGFVRAADKINVALKEDLGGDAEGAIATVGKLVDIFQLEGQYGLESAMLRTGSAINSLGMASTANEGYIVDFTRRLAGIAPNADISITKILGMGATLDKYGQQAETAGTAIGQTIMAMFKRTETFAAIAKMPLQEFTDLLNKDVNEALLRVLEGMNDGGGLHTVVQAMEEMHLNGQRATTILGTLSKNTEELRYQQDLANASFSEGTSLIDEFEVKNESATAVLEKQKKAIQEEVVEIGQKLMPVVNGVMDLADGGLSLLSSLISIIIRYRAIIVALIAVKYADVAVTKLQNAVTLENIKVLVKQVTGINGARTATLLWVAAKKLLTGELGAASKAIKLFFNAIKAGTGPIGWTIAAISLLTATMKPLISRWKEQRELQKSLKESNRQMSESYSDAASQIDRERQNTEQLLSAVRKAKSGSTERAAAIKAINREYKQYLPALLTDKSSNEEVATALAAVNTQLENKIKLQAKEAELTRITSQVNDQTKKTITGFIDVLEKSIGKETSAAMRAEMTQAVLEYKNAISDASLSPSEQKKLRNKLFGTFFDLGGNQKGFRGSTLRGLLNGLDTVIESAGRATELLDQMYGTPSVTTSGIVVDDDNPDDSPLGGGDDDDNWSLSKDKEFLESRLKLKKEYYAGEIETEEELQNRILQLEIDTLSKRLKTASLDADERVSLEEEIQDRLLQQKEAAAKKDEQIQKETLEATAEVQDSIEQIRDRALGEEMKRYEQKKKEYAGDAGAIEALEIQHQHRLSKIQMDYVNGQISEAAAIHERELAAKRNEHQEELAQAKAAGHDLKQLKAEQVEEIAAIDLAYATKLQDILDSVLNLEGKIDIKLAGLTPTELETLRKKLEEIRALRNSMDGTAPDPSSDTETGQKSMFGQTASFLGLSQDEWSAMFDSGVDGWTRMGYAAKAFGQAAQEAMSLVSTAMERQAKLEEQQLKEYRKEQDEKRSVLEQRLDAGLMTEAQYNAELQKMEEDYAKKEEELAMAQAKREKAMSLTQAIINTSLGVTSTLAQWGVPWGLIPAGIMAAMGAAEIALISSTPITTGYAKGGRMKVRRSQDGRVFNARLSPDARGFISSPTALVGEDGTEYVIPTDGVSNPSLAPFLNTIETARRQGTLKDLSYESLYAPTMRGRVTGGFLDIPAFETSAGTSVTGQSEDTSQIMRLLEQILSRLNEPIPAIVQMLGSKGLIEQLEKYYKNKKNGNING